MSKKCQKEINRQLNNGCVNSEVNQPKIDQNFALDLIVGHTNVRRWNELKVVFLCKTNEEFAATLLDLAQQHINGQKTKINKNEISEKPPSPNSGMESGEDEERTVSKELYTKKIISKRKNEYTRNKRKRNICKSTIQAIQSKKSTRSTANNSTNVNTFNTLFTNFQNELPKFKILSNTEICVKVCDGDKDIQVDKNQFEDDVSPDVVLNNSHNKSNAVGNQKTTDFSNQKNTKVLKKCNKIQKHKKISRNREKNHRKYNFDKEKKKSNYDIRKAPELNIQLDEKDKIDVIGHVNDDTLIKIDSDDTVEDQKFSVKIKLCSHCNTKHIQEQCPLQNPLFVVLDKINHEDWLQKYKVLHDDLQLKLQNELQNESPDNIIECKSQENQYTFAYLSLPKVLYLSDSNTSHGLSVYTSTDIKEFSQFGPLIGKIVKEVDIPEDFSMRDLWEVYSESFHIYVNTEKLEECNWIRFVRPANTREERNLSAVSKNDELYLVSIRNIRKGEELSYWQDDILSTNKKKMEKTTCGGCNMTFGHPLYYRTHCSVFHDLRYSLTIRKYHCKICGAAVLGKENIMKHAAELHNGQGAYQCQFCKKFFLRLNYLEMHRTYGCSANPHRSRPLCDFCGRKFCQPQKLKVHIKRMHSDMSEVLKEFQCKSCLKLLGSRAALQRHVKEVHHKQVDGACACSRCGKLFQNKSNLKIHMLTHSGIKPFKCVEKNCSAAFTTKQCLQFHYKKVHGYAEEVMPKIERSVDYTFEAYSGAEGILNEEMTADKEIQQCGSSPIDLNDSSDIDNSCEANNLHETPALNSPNQTTEEHSSDIKDCPPSIEGYTNTNIKIFSKGSKKWLGDHSLPTLKTEIYHLDQTQTLKSETGITLEVGENHAYDRTKLNMNLNVYNRHESSNASLLVEAALDSVSDMHCNESNIDIDVSSTAACTDVLVNNLYTLAHHDPLPDVTYSHSVDMSESRDINLISPSVNDHISVTDDLNDELHHSQNIGLSYGSFPQDDFSPANSPNIQQRNSFVRNYIEMNPDSPQDSQNYNAVQSKNVSPTNSPPRYDFGHTVNADHLSSDDSNGIGVQNLSLHNAKDESQLDLSLYKSSYGLDTSNFQLRKDFRMKFNLESDRKQVYLLEVDDISKNYNDNALHEINNKFDMQESERNTVQCGDISDNISNSEVKHKITEIDSALRIKYHESDSISSELRNKHFEMDLDVRSKTYDNSEDVLRRNAYDTTIDSDFRVKNYDIIENLEARNKVYDSLIETEFRPERNFEPLVLNSNELQGLDMSARSYHNYHASNPVSNLNRYHLYPEVDRPSVDLRLNYSPPPPPPAYSHADVLRVVSLDLSPPGRHSVDLSLRSHSLHAHQIANSRLLSEHGIQSNRLLVEHNRLTLDQSRLLSTDLTNNRHLSTDARLLSVTETSNRILSDHTTNRLLSNDQLSSNRLISEESRLIPDQPRLLDQGRLLTDARILPSAVGSSALSPVPYPTYSVTSSPYHPTPLPPRPPHAASPNPPYHHYSPYY